MADISEFSLDNEEGPTAQVLLPTGRTVALRWLDEDDELTSDEGELRKLADKAIDGLSAEQLEAIEAEIVTELTDSAFEESERETEEEDYRKLAGDMDLNRVTVFSDGIVVLEFTAPNEYPDSVIAAQLDEDFAIDDLLVE